MLFYESIHKLPLALTFIASACLGNMLFSNKGNPSYFWIALGINLIILSLVVRAFQKAMEPDPREFKESRMEKLMTPSLYAGSLLSGLILGSTVFR